MSGIDGNDTSAAFFVGDFNSDCLCLAVYGEARKR